MQTFQEQKDIAEDRFQEIDQRWTKVEDAIRVQTQERNQDLTELHEQLKQHSKQSQTFETQKTKIMSQTLNKEQGEAVEVKENLEQLFDIEAEFRLQNLDQKNQFITNYTQNGKAFTNKLQQYSTSRIGDICGRLEAIDAANKLKTQQTVKELKEEVIGQAKEIFAKDKEKFTQMLTKLTQDTGKQMDRLKGMMKTCQKQRQDSQNKLKIMIEQLMAELEKCSEQEVKQGEVTYDSLLKLLEESCDRIQEAQLR